MYGPMERLSAPLDDLSAATATSRRGFLAVFGLGAAGFAVGCTPPAVDGTGDLLNAFVRVGADDIVTVVIKHQDKGQGIATGLSTLVAEELDADWSKVRYVFAPSDVKRYANTFFGIMQATGGSTGIANSWMQMRQAGAAARQMLVAAAAKAWAVPAAQITAAKGVLSHPSGRTGTFGAFAAAAGREPAPDPATVKVKDPKDFVLIGKTAPRLDSVAKTTGAQVYTQDLHLDGMLTAVVAHPPKFGAVVAGVDDAAARAVPGVKRVVATPRGVAVLADTTYAAIKGREALKVTWDDTKAEQRGSAELLALFRETARTPSPIRALAKGDAAKAIAGAARTITQQYSFPYLAHACMEPMNAVVAYRPGRGADIYAAHQIQTLDHGAAAVVLGLRQDQINLHTLAAGGSFGRRAVPDSDYVSEACMIARAINGEAPVKLVWTREDDMRAGRYRPMAVHDIAVGLDAAGDIVGWKHTVVVQSFVKGGPFEMMLKDGVDSSAIEGIPDTIEGLPNVDLQIHQPDVGVTTLWWRSVGHTHTAYAVETMLDRIAQETGKDPVALRRAMMADDPRRLGVLNLAAEKAGWDGRLSSGPGKGRGVAVHKSFGTYVAQVADVAVDSRGVTVERVVCAVDCGVAVNPDVVKAQMEGGIGFGLSSILHEGITLTGGVVDQGNFDRYRVLSIAEMPTIEVHIVASAEPPTGVGEPGTPPIGPAIANAVAAATGRRIVDLPFGDQVRSA